MKYFIRIVSVLVVILVFFQVIKTFRIDNTGTLTPPINNEVPVAGTWQVKMVESFSKSDEDEGFMTQYISARASFSEEQAIIFTEKCDNPKYKYKSVSSAQFNEYNKNFGMDLSNTKLSGQNAEIVSISSQEKHFYDLLLLGNQKMALIFAKGILYFEKTSNAFEDVTPSEQIALTDFNAPTERKGDSITRSGVLLGIKSVESSTKDKVPTYSYRTIWIAAQNKVLLPPREIEQLLVPRPTGFWKIEITKEKIYGGEADKIITYPIENGQLKASRSSDLVNTAFYFGQNITFIGNDYISLEYVDKSSSQKVYMLKTVPINKPSASRVTISDIYGEKAKDILIGSAKNYLQSSNLSKEVQSLTKISDESFAVTRKNGHWIMKGRLDIDNNSKSGNFNDYNINLSPVPKLANYDQMNLTWSDVKLRHPDCKDIFVSPNDDIAVLVLDSELLVYTIKDHKSLDQNIGRINLGQGNSVIMAEWATGDYMDIWNRTVAKDSKGINY